MLLRTTSKFWEKFPTYTGTSVCEDWLDFSKFYYDIQELEGFDYWKSNYGKRIMLDKDIKGNGTKHYCKENCCFISPLESNHELAERYDNWYNTENHQKSRLKQRINKGKRIKATNIITQEIKYFPSSSNCAKELNTSKGNVYMCLSIDEKYSSWQQIQGWKLEEIDNEEHKKFCPHGLDSL